MQDKEINKNIQDDNEESNLQCPTCKEVMEQVEENRYKCVNRDCLVAFFTPSG